MIHTLTAPQQLHVIEQVSFKSMGYEFAPTKWKWLAVKLWKFLHRIKALQAKTQAVKKFVYETHHADRLTELLVKNIQNIDRYFRDVGNWYFVIGEEDFRELINSEEFRMGGGEMMQLMSGPIGWQKTRYRGVPVCVAPLVKGVFMLPVGFGPSK